MKKEDTGEITLNGSKVRKADISDMRVYETQMPFSERDSGR